MALNYPNKYQILRKFAKKKKEEKHLKRSFYTQKILSCLVTLLESITIDRS